MVDENVKPINKKECDTCHMTMKLINFYQTKRLDEYPDGYLPTCKKCSTMTLDNYSPSTFLDILQKIDVPFIPKEWETILVKYASDPAARYNPAVLGRYIAKMRLVNFKKYTFKDTPQFIAGNEEAQNLFRKQIQKSADRDTIIKELQEASEVKTKEEVQQEDEYDKNQLDLLWKEAADGNLTEIQEPMTADMALNYDTELTLDEKKYLFFKWGKNYSLEDLIKMETLYQETAESFDVSNPNHKDYLKKICKASLQFDRSLDFGDAESAAKYSRMFDMLNKSAKFTAASNKLEKDEYIGSVGELVAICEKEGFIPRYHNDEDPDIVDRTLADMNNYVARLISNEMNLADLIESSIKLIAAEEAKSQYEDATLSDDELMADDYEYVEEDEQVEPKDPKEPKIKKSKKKKKQEEIEEEKLSYYGDEE